MNTLAAMRATVDTARRHARRRSETRYLLGEARLWLDTWLDEWRAGELPQPHLMVLYRKLVRRLGTIADRLSTVAEGDARRAPSADWPTTERNDESERER
ncbi:hypothetical protein [Amycolatopsis sp. NPDC059021]|uniref:hypothetical protein n=1 Tax=Amycolatopsis sp. NPDC059021 TaxID=3346704 RepID=UPI00366AAD23